MQRVKGEQYMEMQGVNKEFYVVETEREKGIYLAELLQDTHETMIHSTTKNLFGKEVLSLPTAGEAKRVAESIKNDAFSDNPRAMKVFHGVTIEEVE